MGELLLTRFVETTALLQLFTPHLSTAYPPGKSWFEKESKAYILKIPQTAQPQ